MHTSRPPRNSCINLLDQFIRRFSWNGKYFRNGRGQREPNSLLITASNLFGLWPIDRHNLLWAWPDGHGTPLLLLLLLLLHCVVDDQYKIDIRSVRPYGKVMDFRWMWSTLHQIRACPPVGIGRHRSDLACFDHYQFWSLARSLLFTVGGGERNFIKYTYN